MPDQRVQVFDYDPAWPDRFEQMRPYVEEVLAPWLAGPVLHIGSTSVPGMRAKPVIDMLAPVRSLPDARSSVPLLSAAGWLYWPDDPHRDDRLWLLRPRPQARTHHLQVIEHDHAAARALVAFRDALRADAALRAEYASLKDRLAERHADDRDAYTAAKAGFITLALRHAASPGHPRERQPE